MRGGTGEGTAFACRYLRLNNQSVLKIVGKFET